MTRRRIAANCGSTSSASSTVALHTKGVPYEAKVLSHGSAEATPDEYDPADTDTTVFASTLAADAAVKKQTEVKTAQDANITSVKQAHADAATVTPKGRITANQRTMNMTINKLDQQNEKSISAHYIESANNKIYYLHITTVYIVPYK